MPNLNLQLILRLPVCLILILSFAGALDSSVAQQPDGRLGVLDLSDSKITTEKLIPILRGQKGWKGLLLSGTQIDDRALDEIGKLIELEGLRLAETKATSSGLQALEGLQKLRSINLGHTRIDDTGMSHLAKLRALKTLYVDDTLISDEGIRQLLALTALEPERC